MENPIKMDDLGGTPIFGNLHTGYICSCLCLQFHQTSVFQDRFQEKGHLFCSWGDYNGDLGLYVSIQFLGQVSFIPLSYRSKHETSLNLHYPNCGWFGESSLFGEMITTYHIFHPSEIDLSRGAFVTCMGSTALNISSHATPYQLVPGSWGLASNRSSLLADSSVLFQILVSCQKTNARTPWLDENPCKDWHLHPFSVV